MTILINLKRLLRFFYLPHDDVTGNVFSEVSTLRRYRLDSEPPTHP